MPEGDGGEAPVGATALLCDIPHLRPGARGALVQPGLAQERIVAPGAPYREALRREPYDLVISDLFLDDTMGFRLYEDIATISPQLAKSMLFLTGAVLSPELHQFLQQHQLQCLYKPFYAQELLDTVARIMQQDGGS